MKIIDLLHNYIMGLSFTTEGGIPFAAADPIRVISSYVIGASITFNCILRAPNGEYLYNLSVCGVYSGGSNARIT